MKWWIPLLLLPLASAHEIGTTRVAARLMGEGEYELAIVTDADSLLQKLGNGTPEERFLDRVTLEFDGRIVRPVIRFSAVPGGEADIRLTGFIPHGARELTWSYGWTFATYAFQAGNDTQWLEGSQRSAPVTLSFLTPAPGAGSRLGILTQYVGLGFTHIVPHGLDHMLFVLGISLLSRRPRSVLLQVSAFTLAHSITLGLTMYGWAGLSPGIVEPMIALSIAYVAIENLFLSELRSWRLGLVFAFGLLHGLGFAGALQELGVPRAHFLTALIGFNAGVEAGQLAVISSAYVLMGWYCANRDWYRSRVVVPASLAIACTAVYWTAERIIG